MPSSMFGGIWIIPCRDSDIDIHDDTQRAFEIIRLLVAQEVSNDQDSKNEDSNIEQLKVQVQTLSETPSDDDGQRTVE